MAQSGNNGGKKIHLRVQNPKLDLDLSESSTVKDIMDLIANAEGIAWDRLQLMDRSNFPPKTLSTNPYLTLKGANIESQTVISVRKLASAQNFDAFKPQFQSKQASSNAPNNASNSSESDNKDNDTNLNSNFGFVSENLSGTMIREKIDDDNSCMFNAVQMCGDETHKLETERTLELREMVASIILSDTETYNKATLDNKSNGEYAQWIMQTNSWGGEIELSILSNILEIIIVAIDIETLKLFKYGNENDYKKTAYLCMLHLFFFLIFMFLDFFGFFCVSCLVFMF